MIIQRKRIYLVFLAKKYLCSVQIYHWKAFSISDVSFVSNNFIFFSCTWSVNERVFFSWEYYILLKLWIESNSSFEFAVSYAGILMSFFTLHYKADSSSVSPLCFDIYLFFLCGSYHHLIARNLIKFDILCRGTKRKQDHSCELHLINTLFWQISLKNQQNFNIVMLSTRCTKIFLCDYLDFNKLIISFALKHYSTFLNTKGQNCRID